MRRRFWKERKRRGRYNSYRSADFSPRFEAEMKWSISPHRPPHLYADQAWYFITASTAGNAHILKTDAHFTIWLNKIRKLTSEFKIKLTAWVALPNHYHILSLPRKGSDIAIFLKRLNGSTSRELNLLDEEKGRTVWYSYWDTCIRGERDFWARFNYIHYNPIKHGHVAQPEDWLFSSYRYYLREDGQDWLAKCWKEFSAPDLVENDEF